MMRDRLLAYLSEMGEKQINLTSESARSQVANKILEIVDVRTWVTLNGEQPKNIKPYDYEGE